MNEPSPHVEDNEKEIKVERNFWDEAKGGPIYTIGKLKPYVLSPYTALEIYHQLEQLADDMKDERGQPHFPDITTAKRLLQEMRVAGICVINPKEKS